MKSVRAFLIGANRSQRSGGRRCGRPARAQTSSPPRRPASATSADHSPSRPLKTSEPRADAEPHHREEIVRLLGVEPHLGAGAEVGASQKA